MQVADIRPHFHRKLNAPSAGRGMAFGRRRVRVLIVLHGGILHRRRLAFMRTMSGLTVSSNRYLLTDADICIASD